jgi:MFS family permease
VYIPGQSNHEPPYTVPYVRWCERTRAERPSPTRYPSEQQDRHAECASCQKKCEKSGLAFFIASYAFIFIFLPLHFTASADTLISLIAYGVLLTISGYIADHVGIEKTLTLGSFLFCLSIPICFLSKNLLVIQLILTSCVCLLIGPIHAWMLTQFQVQHRCRGIFISSGIATSIFGGSTIPICLMIYEKFHSIGICALYPLLLAFGSLLCLRQEKGKEAWL